MAWHTNVMVMRLFTTVPQNCIFIPMTLTVTVGLSALECAPAVDGGGVLVGSPPRDVILA